MIGIYLQSSRMFAKIIRMRMFFTKHGHREWQKRQG